MSGSINNLDFPPPLPPHDSSEARAHKADPAFVQQWIDRTMERGCVPIVEEIWAGKKWTKSLRWERPEFAVRIEGRMETYQGARFPKFGRRAVGY